jgi:hypothetical protein
MYPLLWAVLPSKRSIGRMAGEIFTLREKPVGLGTTG